MVELGEKIEPKTVALSTEVTQYYHRTVKEKKGTKTSIEILLTSD